LINFGARALGRLTREFDARWPDASPGGLRVWHVIDAVRELTGALDFAALLTPTTSGEVPARPELRRFAAVHTFTYAADEQRSAFARLGHLVGLGELARLIDARRPHADVVFVDPWHTYEASLLSLQIGVQMVERGGYLIVHDCFPPRADLISPTLTEFNNWSGETWRAFADFASGLPATAKWFVIDADTGVGVVRLLDRVDAPLHLRPVVPIGLGPAEAIGWMRRNASGAFRLTHADDWRSELSRTWTASDPPPSHRSG
jgi:hypothetical protein